MSITEYLRENEARMRQMRQDGETWETIASLVQSETGEEVNLASLRKTFSQLFSGSEAPAKVEKRVEKTVTKRPEKRQELPEIPDPKIEDIQKQNHDVENIFKSKLAELDKIINESQSKFENAINIMEMEKNRLMNESSEYFKTAITKYTDTLNATAYPTYNQKDNSEEDRKWIIFTRIMYPLTIIFMILGMIMFSTLIYEKYNKPDAQEIWKGFSLSDETLSTPSTQK